MHSYLLNCLGTRSDPRNPSFTAARPQLKLGQPCPRTLSVEGLWLTHKTIQRELKHEKLLRIVKANLSVSSFPGRRCLGIKPFQSSSAFPALGQAPSPTPLQSYAPPPTQTTIQSNTEAAAFCGWEGSIEVVESEP